jgi:hypothetical protein
MKVLLRRSQKSGLLGKVTFTLTVRAELEADEKAAIKKYKFGDLLLYERTQLTNDPGDNWRGVAALLAHRLTNLTISVNDLEQGKSVECKNIMQMLAVEDQVKEAAQTFKAILQAASTFDGEEILDFA